LVTILRVSTEEFQGFSNNFKVSKFQSEEFQSYIA